MYNTRGGSSPRPGMIPMGRDQGGGDGAMARKKASSEMSTTVEKPTASERTSQARLELPSAEMERMRRAARRHRPFAERVHSPIGLGEGG